jgi:hypothetical protein
MGGGLCLLHGTGARTRPRRAASEEDEGNAKKDDAIVSSRRDGDVSSFSMQRKMMPAHRQADRRE